LVEGDLKAESEKQKMESGESKTVKKNENNTPVKRKMSFKEKQEFEALEREIPLLEEEKTGIEEALSSGLLTKDEITSASERFSALMELIDDKTMRWLELSEI
jgi:ATP-binding cassette subfamily F protein uup